MRIATNSVNDSIVRQIQDLATRQARLREQVGTGQRLSRPADDAPAAGRVLNYQSTARRAAQYLRNADRALELSQASYATLTQVKTVADRAGELAILGQGATSAEARAAYAAEVNQLLEQLLQLGNARLGSDHLFAGTALDAPAFTAVRDASGNITAAVYAGDAATLLIPLGDGASLAPLSPVATNEAVGDCLNRLVALRDALAAGDTTALGAAQAGLSAVEDTLVSALAEQGAVQLRIEVNRAQQQALADRTGELIAGETGVDLPQAVVRLNEVMTAYEAALGSSAKVLRLSLLDYLP